VSAVGWLVRYRTWEQIEISCFRGDANDNDASGAYTQDIPINDKRTSASFVIATFLR